MKHLNSGFRFLLVVREATTTDGEGGRENDHATRAEFHSSTSEEKTLPGGNATAPVGAAARSM